MPETEFHVFTDNVFSFANRHYRCAIGQNGIVSNKREGDGGTPSGTFALRRIFFRPDRLEPPQTSLLLTPLHSSDGWCDDSQHRDYNCLVKFPHSARCEKLWRKDRIYDVIVVIGYNDDPPVPDLGSAIFMHVARKGYKPTRGCVALALPDLLEVISHASTKSRLVINNVTHSGKK